MVDVGRRGGGPGCPVQGLQSRNPDVEIINATVAGGGGSAARGVLQTRLAGGDPPDTWQVHPGYELLGQYVEPGYVAPITDLYAVKAGTTSCPRPWWI